MRALLLTVPALFAPALLLAQAAQQTLVLANGDKLTVVDIVRTDGMVRFRTADGAVRQVPEAQVTSPALDKIPWLLRLKSGESLAVNRIARANGFVRFQTLGGAVRQVAEAEVLSPAIATIAQLGGTAPAPAPATAATPPAPAAVVAGDGELVLRSGERIPVTDLLRTDGRVRFRTARGDVRQVPEAEVAAPPLESIPLLLRLNAGDPIPVRRIARANGFVRFETLSGEVRQVAEANVVWPPVAAIPVLGGGQGVGPTPGPTPAPGPEPGPAPDEPPSGPVPFPPAPKPPLRPLLPEYSVMGSRWDILDLLPPDRRVVRGRGIDPYNQNTLKGDKPIAGDSLFFVLTATLDSFTEVRRLPLPSGPTTERPGAFEFFGSGRQIVNLPKAIVSAELFKGQTAFRPKTWALKVTAVGNVNDVRGQERNVLHIDPRKGITRTRQDVSLEEAFAEVKIADLSKKFDTVSARVGIQPFVSDFRGFIFFDFNLGARIFGNAGNNRWQYNLMALDLLEKETNSELNLLEKRKHKVFIANLFRQDFIRKGYTLQFSFHHSRDLASKKEHYDANGFLVRPAKIGSPRLHDVLTSYAGWAGDGHLGRLNVSHALYYAFGKDEAHPLGPRLDPEQDVSALLGALELSFDKDWVRPKLSFFFSSGDDDVDDGKANGFDSIYDGVNFAGGPFSFWNRSGIPLTQTAVLLKAPGSLLPNLRSNKFEGQANYVNPGVMLVGIGADIDLTPKVRAIVNANYLRFHKPGVLSELLHQPDIRNDIGLDLGAGFLWRPLLNENVVITAGVTGLLPAGSFEDLYSSSCAVPGCGAEQRTLVNGFVQVRLTY